MLVAIWLVALCGAVMAAPQDGTFFQKTVVVSADNSGTTSDHAPARQVEAVHTKVVHAPPPPHRQVVQVHKSHSFNPQAAQDFHNSQSGQALDNAGASLFSALGQAATSLGDFLSSLLGRTRKVVVTERRHEHHAPPPREDEGNLVFVKSTRIF